MLGLALSVMLSSGPSAAQDPSPARRGVDTVHLTVAYLGEFILHPGALVGAEIRPVANRRSALTTGPNLGFYVHPRNHVGLFVDYEVGYRFTSLAGFFFQLQAGVGYLHTFLPNPVYERGEDGSIEKHRDGGRPSVMPTGFLGLGWDFSRRHDAPLDAFIRIQAFGQYPFNGYMLPHAALLLGVSYGFDLRPRPKAREGHEG